jgi:hypothetical protein
MITLNNKQINSDNNTLDLEIWKEETRQPFYLIAVEIWMISDLEIKKASSGSVMDNIAEGFEEMEI